MIAQEWLWAESAKSFGQSRGLNVWAVREGFDHGGVQTCNVIGYLIRASCRQFDSVDPLKCGSSAGTSRRRQLLCTLLKHTHEEPLFGQTDILDKYPSVAYFTMTYPNTNKCRTQRQSASLLQCLLPLSSILLSFAATYVWLIIDDETRTQCCRLDVKPQPLFIGHLSPSMDLLVMLL